MVQLERPKLCKPNPPQHTLVILREQRGGDPTRRTGEALEEQQHEDDDKDAAKSDDTDLFCLTLYLTWRSGRWAVSLTQRPSAQGT